MRTILFDDLKLVRTILELRYHHGYFYWDKCGSILLKIRNNTEFSWDREDIKPQDITLINRKKHLFIFFGTQHLGLSQQNLDNVNYFREMANSVVPIIRDELSIKTYTRIGNRYIYVYKTNDLKEAQNYIVYSKLFTINDDKISIFGKAIDNLEFSLTINSEKYNIGIRVSATEIDENKIPLGLSFEKKEYHPNHSVVLDIDIYCDVDTKADDFDVSSFIQESKQKIRHGLLNFLFK